MTHNCRDLLSLLHLLTICLIPPTASSYIYTTQSFDACLLFIIQRGDDIPHSPVFYAYLIVESSSVRLFIDNAKVTKEVIIHLENAGVELRPYETILSEIER